MWEFIAGASTIQVIAVAVFIGATLASIGVYFNKIVIGKAVRAIVAAGADSPESAKTLEDLGLSRSFFVRNALKSRSVLRKYVYEADDRIIALPDGSSYFERDGAIDLTSARFYISEENRVRAEVRYAGKGSDLFVLILSIVVYFGVAWAIVVVFPLLINFWNSFVTG